MQEAYEKKNQRIGLMVSIGLHAAILLFFLFIMAWKEPFPPHPEYGVELNFGLSEQGSGEIQPEQPVLEQSEAQQEEVKESAVQEADEPSEETEDEVVTQPIESPVKVEPKKETVKDPEKKVEVKEKPVETKKEEVKPTETKESKVEEKSHGDDKDKVGDKGKEDGKLDARALMGDQGGGSGSQLEMAGWQWDYEPKPKDTSNDSGRLVFEIKVNDVGEVISVRTLERGVSPSVEQIYRKELERLTFHKTADNSRVAAVSTGKITFIIKSK